MTPALLPEDLVRLSIGIEDAEDLEADLIAAIDHAFGPPLDPPPVIRSPAAGHPIPRRRSSDPPPP